MSKAIFFQTSTKASLLPKSSAEIIFSGRSNVGKSSVINALCSKKNLARTSKIPGRTRSINVYSVAFGKWIIDLPGYGFARISLDEKNLWNKMIEECIIQRKSKKAVYIIIDVFVGPSKLDFNMADWLSQCNIPFKIVANKCDKIPRSITEKEIKSKAGICFNVDESDVFAVSAKKRNGFGELQADIVKFLNGGKN